MSTIQPRTATERAAYIMRRLCLGEKLTTAAVAQDCGMSRQGAYKLLEAMSGATPLLLDDGHWQIMQQNN